MKTLGMPNRMVPRLALTLTLLLAPLVPLRAAEPEETPEQQRWAAFPIIASSPETGLMLGGMLFHFLPTDTAGEQASTIDLMAFGTTKGQYAISLAPNLFLAEGAYRFNTTLAASFWKANYYGLGNDSADQSEQYEATTLAADVSLERRWFDALVLGLRGTVEDIDQTPEPGGMLASGEVAGATGGTYVGLGFEGGIDTRDNSNAPSGGTLARYSYLEYAKGLGSDLGFRRQALQLQHYWKPFSDRDAVAALAATVQKTDGDVPFNHLSSPDGTMILRGIENGRYLDRDLAALQAEYRFPIHKKISGTVFAEAAQVAPGLDEMEIGSFKTSLGTGFRYALNPDQRFNLRADVAWVDGGIGVIINVREAF